MSLFSDSQLAVILALVECAYANPAACDSLADEYRGIVVLTLATADVDGCVRHFANNFFAEYIPRSIRANTPQTTVWDSFLAVVAPCDGGTRNPTTGRL